ncbi:MAG: DUF5011 domain-containing protein [Saccharofermentans sp.]|nr:DUF5011 domain-containing protein [Saccharofermentans sp.]
MQKEFNRMIKRSFAVVLTVAVTVASFTGCKTGNSRETERNRDVKDRKTEGTTAETTPEVTPLPTATPTSSPSPTQTATPTPSIPHMNQPEKDITAPFFLNLPESVSVEVGSDFDIQRYIGYVDDCDSDVELLIEGEVDTSDSGSYPLTLTLADDAGNTKTGSMTVNVYVPSGGGGGGGGGSSEHTTLAYSDFMDRYPDSDIAYGIDVSRYQGDIDFEKVRDAGCEFVMLRAMIYNNGELGEDRKFEEYYEDAKAAGLLIGVYYYSTDCDIEELHDHCDELLAVLEGKELDLPVAFDWESWSHFQKYNMSIVDINNLFYEFAGIMEANGYSTILYGSKYYLEIIWEPAGYDVWLAHYVRETSYEGDYTMWQTGSIGRIDGISEDCDTDILFKSKYPHLFGG